MHTISYAESLAITEMVPDPIWAPDIFGPQEIRSPRSLGPEKLGPPQNWPPPWKSLRHFHTEIKFLGDQISQEPKKSGAQMRLGTISVIAESLGWRTFVDSRGHKRWILEDIFGGWTFMEIFHDFKFKSLIISGLENQSKFQNATFWLFGHSNWTDF